MAKKYVTRKAKRRATAAPKVVHVDRPDHPFVVATNAVQLGTRSMADVVRREGQQFADVVAFALRQRKMTKAEQRRAS